MWKRAKLSIYFTYGHLGLLLALWGCIWLHILKPWFHSHSNALQRLQNKRTLKQRPPDCILHWHCFPSGVENIMQPHFRAQMLCWYQASQTTCFHIFTCTLVCHYGCPMHIFCSLLAHCFGNFPKTNKYIALYNFYVQCFPNLVVTISRSIKKIV